MLYINKTVYVPKTRKMPDGIMDRFFSTVLEQATYSGRNKGIFLKKSNKSHFLKKKKKRIPVLEQSSFHLLSTKFRLNPTSFGADVV